MMSRAPRDEIFYARMILGVGREDAQVVILACAGAGKTRVVDEVFELLKVDAVAEQLQKRFLRPTI